ncbi:SUKH-3 domain-containing protein [Streptomyces barkulensis]|uniref:SUKH-3 domain-containing protein n=1 Tax=Streptomyces barkulensis TaxID=1257026 RepID=UPI00117D7151|nr:SUKH-3 domain-containing protein [Streptomyces barkulensis]
MRKEKDGEAMRFPSSRQEAEAWFRQYGWSPERDIGAEADALIQKAREQAAEYGVSYVVSEYARDFIRSFGGLRILFDDSPENHFVTKPGFAYKGDAEGIEEFSGELGESLFPLGFDTYDGAVMLVDGRGRFFLMHHTGNYYLGDDALQAVTNFMTADMEDAEDFYV